MSHTCGCSSNTNSYYNHQVVSICDPCNTNTGCPIQLDWDCLIYHKSNNEVSNLTFLELTNGATLTQFAEVVDTFLSTFDVESWDLPYLRDSYTINTLQQFAESVDTELDNLASDIATIETTLTTGITVTDTQSINFTSVGFNLTGSLIVDPAVNNRLTVSGSGVLVAPQNLNPDYDTKTLGLTGSSNVVNMSSFFTTTSGYLGSVASDPVGALDGQMWYNTTDSKLRFKVSSSLTIDLN